MVKSASTRFRILLFDNPYPVLLLLYHYFLFCSSGPKATVILILFDFFFLIGSLISSKLPSDLFIENCILRHGFGFADAPRKATFFANLEAALTQLQGDKFQGQTLLSLRRIDLLLPGVILPLLGCASLQKLRLLFFTSGRLFHPIHTL